MSAGFVGERKIVSLVVSLRLCENGVLVLTIFSFNF